MIVLGSLLVWLSLLHKVQTGGTSCQDIDHNACLSMAKQNQNMCSDPVLSHSACPAFCSICPVTCYNCNATTADVSQCNTITCSSGEMCLLRMAQTGSGSRDYTMMCGPSMVCSLTGKRFVMASDISITCCSQDLCNAPPITTTTSTITTKKTTTITTPTTTTPKPTPLPHTSTKHTKSTHIPYTTIHWGSHITPKPTEIHVQGCVKDLIFMIEDSLPMMPYFGAIKNTIRSFISQLHIGLHQTRVALGTFNWFGTTRWELNRYTDKTSLQNAVDSLTQSGLVYSSATNLAAVEHALQNFKKGNRYNVPDVIVLLTEGSLHNDLAFIGLTGHTGNAAISQLHQRYHNVIAIAAGSADASEVRHIATDSNHYFHINNYLDWMWNQIDRKVMNLICH